MEDILHHDTSILYGFKDPFMRKESARDKSFNFFKFISPTISTWAQLVSQGMLNSISNYTLKELLHRSESMSYKSMTYLYSWMMEQHQPIGIDYCHTPLPKIRENEVTIRFSNVYMRGKYPMYTR